MKRVETLDGLRGYAVLMILLAHLPVLKKGLASQWLNGVPAIMRFGYLGVDLFFALSGFLITRILINEKRQNSYSFKRFYIRRALRIFPAYYLCIILVGILISNSQLIPVALYYNNYYSVFAMENPAMAHSWTLAVEEHFYLLWPVLLYFLDLKNAKRVISFLLPTFAILSGICAYLMFNQMDAGELLYKSTNSRMLTLALGSYMAFREDECRKLNFRKLSIYFAAAMLLYFLAFWFTSDQLLIVRQWATFLCVPPLSLVLLISAIRVNEDESAIKQLFTNRPITFMGTISYGLYLYHFPVFYIMGIMPGRAYNVNLANVMGGIACTFIVASISYFAIEKPFLALKGRLNYIN